MNPYQTPPPENPLYKPPKALALGRERGGCLTAWLGVSLALSLIGAVLFLQVLDGFRPGALRPGFRMPFSSFAVVFMIGLTIADIVCLYGTWNWKRWGVYGLVVVAIVSPLAESMLGRAAEADFIAPIVQMVILWLLLRNKWQYFE